MTRANPRSALDRTRRSGIARPSASAPSTTRFPWLVAGAASAGAGLVHLALGPGHVEALGVLGAGFFLAAGFQLGWAALAVAFGLGPSRRSPADPAARLAIAGIAINAAILAAWGVSKVVGLPAGEAPWTPEAVGVSDAVAALFEAALVVGLGACLRGWRASVSVRSPALHLAGAALAIAIVATGTVVALLPPEAGHSHAADHAHDDAAAPGHAEVHADH